MLRNIHGYSQEGLALVPAELFEAKIKRAMEYASVKSEE